MWNKKNMPKVGMELKFHGQGGRDTILVEAGGVEPPSDTAPGTPSTRVVPDLILDRRAPGDRIVIGPARVSLSPHSAGTSEAATAIRLCLSGA